MMSVIPLTKIVWARLHQSFQPEDFLSVKSEQIEKLRHSWPYGRHTNRPRTHSLHSPEQAKQKLSRLQQRRLRHPGEAEQIHRVNFEVRRSRI